MPPLPSLQRLFRTKSLEQIHASAEESSLGLRRSLGALDLTLLGIGAIIGAGIFSTIGTAAAGNLVDGRLGAGPALALSFLLTAIACGFTALCYAEFASLIPIAGSAYTYAYAAFGELVAWVIGWDLVLEYAVSNVAVSISSGDYARGLLSGLGFHLPDWLAIDPRSALTLSGGAVAPFTEKLALFAQARAGLIDGGATFTHWPALAQAPVLGGFPITFNLLAIVLVVAITWLCYVGVRKTARANAILVAVKLLVLFAVIGVGAFFVSSAHWTPFAPNGMAGVQAGAAIIFFAFIGFDAVSTTAQECREPGWSLPRGILWSLGICTVIYIAVTAVVTGMVPYTELAGKADPLAYVFFKNHLPWLAGAVSVGAVFATAAALLVLQMGQPRILMAMSHDGLLAPWFGRVHRRYGTPGNATLLTGVVVAIPAAFMNISEVVELANIGTLFAFSLVCIGVLVLRVRRPEAPRRFRVPGVWAVAPLGVLSCLWLVWGLPAITFERFILWLVIGLAVYFVYGYRRSRLLATREN